MIIDRNKILNDLKRYKGFDTEIAFAKFLGISGQNLSGWRRRNAFNFYKITEKFPEIDPNFIATGQGEMLKSAYAEQTDTQYEEPNNETVTTDDKTVEKDAKNKVTIDVSHLQNQIEFQKKMIEELQEQIEILKKNQASLLKLL